MKLSKKKIAKYKRQLAEIRSINSGETKVPRIRSNVFHFEGELGYRADVTAHLKRVLRAAGESV